MGTKRKLKNLVEESPLRQPKRCPELRFEEPICIFTQQKSLNNNVHINNLPDEILTSIFCYFNPKELYCHIRPVCRKWMVLSMSPILWKEIDVKNDVPTRTLICWIRTSRLLKIFSMQDRNDTNVIAKQLAGNCKHLESLKLQNCWGSPECCLIRSTPLCNLVARSANLRNFDFTQSRFISRKFFRLISQGKGNGKIMKRCNYVGPMTLNQIKSLVLSLRDYEVDDTATIGNVSFANKFKLVDIIRYYQELEYIRNTINDIRENRYGVNEEQIIVDEQPI